MSFAAAIHLPSELDVSGPYYAGQPAAQPPAEGFDLPYLLVALDDVRVHFGVMNNEAMQDAEDMVEGDCWSFKSTARMVPTDMRVEQGRMRLRLSDEVRIGTRSFVASDVTEVTLMADDGTLVIGQFLRDSDATRYHSPFLLLPADIARGKHYELIALRH